MAHFRVDSQTEEILKQLASRRGQEPEEIIRDAIDLLAHREKNLTAYDRLRSFIGSCDSGGEQLSEKTGKEFAGLNPGKGPCTS